MIVVDRNKDGYQQANMQLSIEISAMVLIIVELVIAISQADDILAKRDIEEELISSLSPRCSRHLMKVNSAYQNSSLTPSSALKEFYTTFGHGKSDEFFTDSRFKFRMLLCFKLAGEHFLASKTPTTFCYRYDPKQYRSAAHTVCFPMLCSKEQDKFWNIYEKTLGIELPENSRSVSTCINSRRQKQWWQESRTISEKIFLAFSAKQNVRMIFKAPKNRSKVITCMFGIRFLTMIWIVIGHTFAFVALGIFQPYIENVDEYYHDIADNFANQWITNFFLSVDVFFVLGGTVNAYGFFQQYKQMNAQPTWTSLKFWLNFYVHRIIRLWPAYCWTLIVVYFFSSLIDRELWPEIDHNVQCSKYWWQNLLLVASLFEHRCMRWAWYISTEFIFYLFSPVFLLALARNQNRGYLLSIFCIALSNAGRAYVMFVYNMPPTQLGWNTPPIYNSNYIEQYVMMYIKPQYRAAPYIIGLLLGYHLVKIQANELYYKRHSATFVACGWILAIFSAFISVYGLYPVLINLKWEFYYLIYGAFHRTTFAVATAWLIYACHSGYGSFVNTFLSSKLFLPLSALCYTVR
ncbi:unnamed protein product [Onchocerca ochengi]|uniref:Acyl_transf_3 domain-containing protein n=1 Tax=Onchocerca ochengi TaxID=42157 RepID=A0A182E456_ONCOC|nr:unnamed protein product [Onchocerca ochengi]